MFLREGSQLGATLLSIACGLTICTTVPSVAASGDWTPGISKGVELPREILPWRHGVEHTAAHLLEQARQSVRKGDIEMAEHQLRDLLRRYPQTHAASDGKVDLSRLLERRVAKLGRQRLGAPVAKDFGRRQQRIDPVAGWNTTITPSLPDIAGTRDALIEAAGDRVFFDDGSARISRPALAVLKNQARWLAKNEEIEVRIVGHADDGGSAEENLRLSHDRAVAVRNRLIRFGVAPRRLHVFSYGKAKPIAICAVATCAAQNRRVVTEIRARRRADAVFD